MFIFNSNGEGLNIYYIEGAAEVKIASGSSAKGNAICILVKNEQLKAIEKYGTDNEKTLLDGFSFSRKFAYVGAIGTTEYVTTDRNMQVNINTGVALFDIDKCIPTLIMKISKVCRSVSLVAGSARKY